MLIDAHLHCSGRERTPGVLRTLDDAEVDVGVLLAPFLSEGYSLHDAASLRRANRHLAQLVRGHGDRLVGLAVVDPSSPDACDAVQEAVDAGLHGVKMVPSGWHPHDDAVQPAFARMAQLRLPLLFHSGIFIDGRSGRFCRPVFFEALRAHPGVRVTLAHLGWPWTDEAIAVGLIDRIHGVAEDDALFRFDLSFGAPPPYRLPSLRNAVEVLGAGLLQFGSDCFLPCDGADLRARRREHEVLLDQPDLDAAARQRVFAGTAAAWLRRVAPMNEAGLQAVTAPAAPTQRRLHVLQIIGNAIVGGVETWVLRTLERLPRERFRFTALCPFESRFSERLRALEVDVMVAQMPLDPPWSTIQMAAALTSAGQVDVLHAHLPRAHLLGGLVARLTERPLLATIHGRQLTPLDLEVHRVVHSHLSVVCRPTYYHALGMGVPASLLSCEPNGVDGRLFAPRRRGGDGGLRREPGLDAATPLVGVVGRLSSEKGPQVALRAAMSLRLRCPAARWVFVGDGGCAPTWSARARLQLDDVVHFVGLRDDMPALYNELDALLCSSHTEGMPLVLMEAMASALPVVASRVGGVPELVAHGESGWLVADGDFEDMAGCLAGLLDGSERARRFGAAARERALSHFALDAAADRVGALLERVAAEAERPLRMKR